MVNTEDVIPVRPSAACILVGRVAAVVDRDKKSAEIFAGLHKEIPFSLSVFKIFPARILGNSIAERNCLFCLYFFIIHKQMFANVCSL